ncbi:MAG: alpha-mannosidase [Tannerellaceae bacterium]|nr:alpha-mannosidase [Tannerellaceae bacterium]
MKTLKSTCFLLWFACMLSQQAQAQPHNRMPAYDLTKDKVLYTVGYSHLDTQWNWDYVRSIDELIKNIMTENFTLFEEYPDYVFNFTGSRRYRMMKEYYPDLYEKVKEYVAKGRWLIAGSAVDEGEVIISSPESIIRQTLYGYKYFMKEFGVAGRDAIFPDIFGFPANLPTIWRHSGLIGFSTIKLTGNCAVGIPFPVGVWKGPDGSRLVSALNPGHYVSSIPVRFDRDDYWSSRLDWNKEQNGYAFDFRFYGIGDEGGAPLKNDVKHATECLTQQPDSKFRILLTASDQMFKDITPEIEAKLPVYEGDFLLVEHSNGSSVSQGFMKRMNRKNENLAQAAEQAATGASILTGVDYPADKFTNAWELVLGSQMHDILPGTSIPKAYEYSWNDEFVAANTFASAMKNGLAALSTQLNTQTQGRSVVVYNPTAYRRQDIVTVEMSFDSHTENIKAYHPDGKETPVQVIDREENKLKFIFLADVPSAGFTVYDIRPSNDALRKGLLTVTDRLLENEYYRVTLADNGDIKSIYDKKLRKELLKAPARLEFLAEAPSEYPAWNMDWKDRREPPVGYLDEQASFRVVEDGPLRVALEVTRQGRNSSISQIISLAASEPGKRIEVANRIDWQSLGVCLKASFPFTAGNEMATYNQGVGTIMRNNNHPRKYEVPHHNWIDLTDASGKFGVSIMEDCKYTSDKPDDHTLRLTLMFTPKTQGPSPQATQDFGIHYIKYAIYAHEGDWRQGETGKQSAFVDHPLIPFETPRHAGTFGKQLSLLSLSNRQIGVMAFKKAENSDYCIVRVNELTGRKQANVKMKFPLPVIDAYEVDGREERTGNAVFTKDAVSFDIPAYAIKSFAVKLSPASVWDEEQMPVTLAYNDDAVSSDGNRPDGRMNHRRRESFRDSTYPAEEMPKDEYVHENVLFKMGSYADETNNVVACAGQEIALPQGDYDRLYLLAAASDETGDKTNGVFRAGGKDFPLQVAAWRGFTGQHYNRRYRADWTLESLSQPFVRKDDIAWFASHYHDGYPSKNMSYRYCYLFQYEIAIPQGSRSVILPDNQDIKIFAITAVKKKKDDIVMLQPLYDDFKDNPAFSLRSNSVK